jgi:hypothetical protein
MEKKDDLGEHRQILCDRTASFALVSNALFCRKMAESVSDSASIVHSLVMDVRDSKLHCMRGPGPQWRAKHQS